MVDARIIFANARSKVERAYHHIHVLESIIQDFSSTPFFEVVLSFEEGNGWMPVVRPLRPTPDDMPLIVGDAVHNFRSALEHMVYALVSDRTTTFPMHKCKADFESNSVKLDQIEDVLPGAKVLLSDGIQPYSDGNGALLYALHSLDLSDKHHRIILTTTAAIGGNLQIIEAGEIRLSAAGIHFNPNQETVIQIGPWTAEAQIRHDQIAELEVLFGEPDVLSGEAVIPSLLRIGEKVEQAIADFSALAENLRFGPADNPATHPTALNGVPKK